MRALRALIGLDALWQFELLVETAVEVGGLVALAWLAARALRARPALSHAAWTVGLGAALLLPLAGAVLPQRPLHYPLPDSLVHLDNVPDLGPLRAGLATVVAPEMADREPVGSAPAGSAAAGPGPLAWALLAWALGSAIAGARMARAAWRVRRIVRAATPVADADALGSLARIGARIGARRARLLESGAIDVPITVGALRPAIVLPRGREWSPATRDLVLAHELAHVRRLDWIHHLVGGAAAALYWFHPLVRIAARRQRHEAERASDLAVLGTGVAAPAYALGILDVVRDLRGRPAVRLAVPFADPARLESRLRAILAPRATRPRAAAIALVFALLAASVAGAALVRPGVGPSDSDGKCREKIPAVAFFCPEMPIH